MGGFKCVNTLFDEDLAYETDVKTSADYFCRFKFNGKKILPNKRGLHYDRKQKVAE